MDSELRNYSMPAIHNQPTHSLSITWFRIELKRWLYLFVSLFAQPVFKPFALFRSLCLTLLQTYTVFSARFYYRIFLCCTIKCDRWSTNKLTDHTTHSILFLNQHIFCQFCLCCWYMLRCFALNTRRHTLHAHILHKQILQFVMHNLLFALLLLFSRFC